MQSGLAVSNTDSRQVLRENYTAFLKAREPSDKSSLTLPFDLESNNDASDSSASIRYLLKDVEFDRFVGKMQIPEEWCEFIPLHLNIKACAYLKQGDRYLLRFYAGIKGYQSPDKAHILQFDFNHDFKHGVLYVNLFARDGPLDSSDINFRIRAIGVENDGVESVYLEFDLTSKPGLAASLMKIYLATVARKKIGFSIVGKRWNGESKFVSGARGATERNIVRYLLAIETYFSTLDVNHESRFTTRLEHWYDATDRFRNQLYELSRKKYLANKKRERKNQQMLQDAIDRGVDPGNLFTDR